MRTNSFMIPKPWFRFFQTSLKSTRWLSPNFSLVMLLLTVLRFISLSLGNWNLKKLSFHWISVVNFPIRIVRLMQMAFPVVQTIRHFPWNLKGGPNERTAWFGLNSPVPKQNGSNRKPGKLNVSVSVKIPVLRLPVVGCFTSTLKRIFGPTPEPFVGHSNGLESIRSGASLSNPSITSKTVSVWPTVKLKMPRHFTPICCWPELPSWLLQFFPIIFISISTYAVLNHSLPSWTLYLLCPAFIFALFFHLLQHFNCFVVPFPSDFTNSVWLLPPNFLSSKSFSFRNYL